MDGYIHSIETMGSVDGPGLRYVVFTAGCPLRCKYCHNPDTWDMKNSKKISSEEILEDYENYRPYLKNGGLTVTGGEPLVQLDFVIDLFEKAKKRDIHTCLDTSGATFSIVGKNIDKFKKLSKVTDLVMLDIKHIKNDEYYELTKGNLDETLLFLDFLSEDETYCDVLVRHVLVKGITYKKGLLYDLGYMLGGYKNVKGVDVLPYHVMGTSKYKELGMKYPLEGLEAMPKENAIKAREIVKAGVFKRVVERREKLKR
ncbi:MAG: pyruvate formate-lyase 1-activating enzyme [Candidatus Cloacimonadota bacterium]|nr:MAG: pyruvate formate-lyase 1-activating enzyme [Candidatus Cloacimonadota bacterium]